MSLFLYAYTSLNMRQAVINEHHASLIHRQVSFVCPDSTVYKRVNNPINIIKCKLFHLERKMVINLSLENSNTFIYLSMCFATFFDCLAPYFFNSMKNGIMELSTQHIFLIDETQVLMHALCE